MQKVDDNDMEKVSGGKVEHSQIGESFDHEKRTCDDCGKLLIEKMTALDELPGYSAYKIHDGDYGINDDDCNVDLCRDCYKKRLMKR